MNQVVDTAVAPAAEERQIFGQPRGLATLFLTEMWERFSFYGARAMLILFMTATTRGGLGLADKTASSIYGLYLGGSYLTSLAGGWIADRLIGPQRAIVAGGIFIMIGNAMLASGSTQVPADPVTPQAPLPPAAVDGLLRHIQEAASSSTDRSRFEPPMGAVRWAARCRTDARSPAATSSSSRLRWAAATAASARDGCRVSVWRGPSAGFPDGGRRRRAGSSR